MPLATEKGKKYALQKLNERRENKPEIPDNSSFPTGSPMYFGCITCGAIIAVPEDYIDRRKLCDECQALKELGWLR
jgi:hypothetical protein